MESVSSDEVGSTLPVRTVVVDLAADATDSIGVSSSLSPMLVSDVRVFCFFTRGVGEIVVLLAVLRLIPSAFFVTSLSLGRKVPSLCDFCKSSSSSWEMDPHLDETPVFLLARFSSELDSLLVVTGL